MDIVDFALWVPWAFAHATLVAVVAAASRRWELARRIAKAVVVALLLYPPFFFVLLAGFGNGDASAKATAWARLLQLFCFDYRALSAIVSATAAPIIWFLAARPVRRQQATRR